MAELTDQERVALLHARLGLPEGALEFGLALQALRHGSFVHERSLAPGRELLRSNERLEFLGDAVLGFCTAQRVYARFPEAPEGDLTRLRASLVREESLALVARELGLGEVLLLGRGEQRSGGRENPSRLADGLEAVIGAVYLSGGVGLAQEVVDRLLAPLFLQSDALGRDPKTELQQLFQARRRSPQYHILSVAGPDHARVYEVEVRLDGTALARGSGRSKKEAEQAAARAALEAPHELQQALLDEPVALKPHDPRWREQFAEEAARLKGVLTDQAVAIEHIGSTAVDGLEAKPVIDLLVGVKALDPALRLPDYEACGEAGVPGRLWFRRRGAHAFNAHVVVHGSDLWRDNLLLRDFLRAHADEAEQYALARRAALETSGGMLLRYSEQKAPALQALLDKARAQ